MSEDIATQRRNAIEAHYADQNARSMAQLEQAERDKPLKEQAARWAKEWNKHPARPVQTLLAQAGIVRPHCPCCGKKATANIRQVVIAPNTGHHVLGQEVTGNFGVCFKYIGAVKFKVGYPAKVGEIIADCPDGTFGRADHFPFCTARCCCAFARASYKAGYRMTGAPR